MVTRGSKWKKKDRRGTGGGKNWREGNRKEGEEERGPEPAETNGEKSVFV